MRQKTLLFLGVVCILTQSLFSDVDRSFFDLQRALRRIDAHTVKAAVAQFDEQTEPRDQPQNSDEQRYRDLRGSFGKALEHLNTGFINRPAFASLVRALQSRSQSDFNAIPLGTPGGQRLVNPQGAYAYSLLANDGWIPVIPPAPSFASAETAGEMVELYWTVLVRDVPFNEFSTDATVADAVADLNTLTNFKGPRIGGVVTPGTFLRGTGPGEIVGPYISQFLYLTVPFGTTTIPPEQTVPQPGTANDFNTTFADWFTVITGGSTGDTIALDGTPRFLRTPRDLGEYVHRDNPIQEAVVAANILLSFGPAALDPANPYLNNRTQEGFVTFGAGQILSLVAAVADEALKAAWYQKWQVNRRLRPEEYGFYVEETLTNQANMGIHAQLLTSPALPNIQTTYGSYFLPQAYPEGSPSHPSYPAGHACFIGAVVTVLKALFNESFEIPSPVEPDATNTSLVSYVGPPLTVGSELNKLASNIALGRDHAGVHYRSDGACGLQLGEKIAIDLLNNDSFIFNEDFSGYTLTKFNGRSIRVGAKREV